MPSEEKNNVKNTKAGLRVAQKKGQKKKKKVSVKNQMRSLQRLLNKVGTLIGSRKWQIVSEQSLYNLSCREPTLFAPHSTFLPFHTFPTAKPRWITCRKA